MLDEFKKHISSIKILVTLLIIAVGIYIFQTTWQFLAFFSDVFLMLISAWLLSFILEPIVEYTSKKTHIKKLYGALIIYVLFLGILVAMLFIIIPSIAVQTQRLLLITPKLLVNYPAFVSKFADVASAILSNSLSAVPYVANFFLSVFLAVIISFYFIVDKDHIMREFYSILPKRWHKDAQFIQITIDNTFESFLRVQLYFAILSGVVTWLVLLLFRVDFAAISGFAAGVLTIVPFLGPVLALIPPLFVCIVTGSPQMFFVIAVLIITQQIIFNVIGPKLMGNAFKLHPVIVLLSFIVGYKIAGGVGAIFAVPVLGVLIVSIHRISRHFINPEETK